MRTFSAKKDEVVRKWYIVDLDGQNLGRVASRIAMVLRGKHKPIFTPHVDAGDFVIVVNAGKVAVTGRKLTDKVYYHHSNFPGGIKSITLEKQLVKAPERVITEAVRGMLPKNRLGRQLLKKLKVYSTADHPHAAQMPEPWPSSLRLARQPFTEDEERR